MLASSVLGITRNKTALKRSHDYFGLHPKQKEARSDDNLNIMSGSLGICLQGAHPDLAEGTEYDANLAKKIHDVNVKVETRFVWIHIPNSMQLGMQILA